MLDTGSTYVSPLNREKTMNAGQFRKVSNLSACMVALTSPETRTVRSMIGYGRILVPLARKQLANQDTRRGTYIRVSFFPLAMPVHVNIPTMLKSRNTPTGGTL